MSKEWLRRTLSSVRKGRSAKASNAYIRQQSHVDGAKLAFDLLGMYQKRRNKPANSTNQTSQSAESTPAKVGEAKPAGVPPGASSAAIIATADGEKSGTRVEVTEWKRSSDNTVTLRFAMVNESPDKVGFGYDYVDNDHRVKDFGGTRRNL